MLKDQIAIVAGGSKGIGRSISTRFAKSGAQVVVVARDPVAVNGVVDEIKRGGGKALGINADCTKRADVDRMIDTVTREIGAPDVLVNTIGGGTPELILRTSDELFDQMINLNVRTAFLLSRAVAPAMIGKGHGKIVHTSSIGAKLPSPGLAVYDGCKAFVVAFTRDLALELGRFGINVNCVCPGHIPTEATREVGVKLGEITGMSPAQLMEMVTMRMAIQRFPTADGIAELYLFLASSAADCMTGQAINFSSGLEMR